VDAHFLAMRDAVLAQKKPRQMMVQPNMLLDEQSGSVTLETYASDAAGVCRSFGRRFEADDAALLAEWSKDKAAMM
jgi:hypothetical protein